MALVAKSRPWILIAFYITLISQKLKNVFFFLNVKVSSNDHDQQQHHHHHNLLVLQPLSRQQIMFPATISVAFNLDDVCKDIERKNLKMLQHSRLTPKMEEEVSNHSTKASGLIDR